MGHVRATVVTMKQRTISRLIITDTEEGGVSVKVEFEGAYDPDSTRPSQAFLLEMLENMRSPPDDGYGPGTFEWTKKEVEKKTQRKF